MNCAHLRRGGGDRLTRSVAAGGACVAFVAGAAGAGTAETLTKQTHIPYPGPGERTSIHRTAKPLARPGTVEPNSIY